jgi:hypothetical protein
MDTNISLTRNSTAARKSRNYSKIYAALLLFVIILAVSITGCKKDDFEGEISGVCPVVTSDPIDGAVNVAVNKVIGLTFNTDMKGSTVNTTTVTLKQGTTSISGTVGPAAKRERVYLHSPAATGPLHYLYRYSNNRSKRHLAFGNGC